MKIIRKSCAEGARTAVGLTVIIDVFRAFSCEPLFFYFNAQKVILEADPEKALALRRSNPSYILIGEINGIPMEGADMGNSPSEVIMKGESFFSNKTVIHRSTAGVTGVTAAFKNTDQIYLGSFMLAKSLAACILELNPDQVTLVAMGDGAKWPAPEDEACADYLEHLLTGKTYDHVKALREVVFQPTAQQFIQGKNAFLPNEDPLFCLQRDLFDFLLTIRYDNDQLQVYQLPWRRAR